jgi:hypothetical protein
MAKRGWRRWARNKNTLAFWLAMLSSILLFISGTTGAAHWTEIKNIILTYFNLQWINLLLVLAVTIASLGALAVFAGGMLILKKKVIWGRILIYLGSGAGIISFIFNFFVSFISANLSIYSYLSFSSLGVIFALLAQVFSRSKKN